MAWSGGGFEFPEYVSVGTRRARARAAAEKIARKQKRRLAPVGPIDGNKLVRNFWGKAWCDNLESYGDYANRLPRGRSYVRHGAVIDLQIAAGSIAALISGTSIYEVGVTIRSLTAEELDARSLPSAPGRSTHSSICSAASFRRRSWSRHAQGRRLVSRAQADLLRVLVPGLGGDVQARRRHALRCRRSPGREARAALRPSWRGSCGSGRRRAAAGSRA